MQYRDKGLCDWRGRPLVAHALDRLAQQQGGPPAHTLISANRHLAQYREFGCPVYTDANPSHHLGPLAGVLSGLQHSPNDWLLTVPCDCPRFPLDLLQRLTHGLQRSGAELAVAQGLGPDGQPRLQPTFALMTRQLTSGLQAFLDQGGRRVSDWLSTLAVCTVSFCASTDRLEAFFNANAPDDLLTLDRHVAGDAFSEPP